MILKSMTHCISSDSEENLKANFLFSLEDCTVGGTLVNAGTGDIYRPKKAETTYALHNHKSFLMGPLHFQRLLEIGTSSAVFNLLFSITFE